jgi:hypothetical protein
MYPCFAHRIEADKFPDVHQLVNDTTVGDTLSAKLHVIFPAEATDMRDRYVEMYMKHTRTDT